MPPNIYDYIQFSKLIKSTVDGGLSQNITSYAQACSPGKECAGTFKIKKNRLLFGFIKVDGGISHEDYYQRAIRVEGIPGVG
jgi:hypothetical protein